MIANAWLSVLRRRRFWLLMTLGAVFLGVVSPFLWAGYHAYAAQTAMSRYHSAETLTHLHACRRVWPWSRNPRLCLLAARAARRQGDFEQASEMIHECQSNLHDNSAEAVLEWTMLRAAMGDLEVTVGFLQETAQAQPHVRPVIYEALAEGYLTMARILDALRATDAWLALEPNSPQAWFVRGKIHRQVGAVQAAAADYQRVLELDAERIEARWWLALALLDIGRYHEADQQLEIFGRSRPQDIEVKVRRAVCLWRLEREAEARGLLEDVLAEHPHHGLALLTRGQMLLKAFRSAEAEPWLRQAASVLPYDYAAQNALWECLRQQRKSEEAEVQHERTEALYERGTQLSEVLHHLMQQRPDDPALHYKAGTLYLQLGSPQFGEAWLLSALRLNEHYLPALEALANYYQEHGDSERAEEYRRQMHLAKNSPARKSHE
jgi:tetratricopeptide (TPR) repeat protein